MFLLSVSTLATAKSEIPTRISFQNLLENKDITLGTVTAFLQDAEGFMWFGGANALIRYDGYEFKQIDYLKVEDGEQEKVPLKFVQALFQANDGEIWIATRTGMFRYNPKLEEVSQVKDSPSKSFKLSTTDLWQTQQLAAGEIVVAATIGLVVIDPQTEEYSLITPDTEGVQGMVGQRVNSVLIDAANPDIIWLGTEAGIERVTWSSKTFELFKPYKQNPQLVSANNVRDIVVDQQGHFWVGTANGLVYFDPESHQAQRFVKNPQDKFSLSGNDIWKLLIDSKGDLWIASDGGGVSVFDQTSNRFINHMFEAGRPGSLNSNQVRTVYEDLSGDIWVGNYPSGINFFDRSSSAITSYARVPSNPNSLSHSSILSVKEDHLGNLWLGTDGGGLNYFDRNLDQFTHYKHDPNNPASLGSNAVLTVFIDSEGLVWMGMWGGGAAYLNPKTQKVTRLPYDEQRAITGSVSESKKLNSAHVWSVRQDKNQKHIYWMTTHTGGLSKYNRNTETFTHYTTFPGDPNSLASNQTWTSFEDSKGRLWVGTNAGLSLLDRETNKFKTFTTNPDDPQSLSNPSVLSIFEDSQGRLWFGTDAGLNLFHRKGNHFTRYMKADGFNDDVIRQILEDESGTLWLSTNNGVSSFNPETKAIKNYNRESGRLVGGFHTESGIVSRRGEVIFGGVNGLRIFKPQELVANTNIPPVVFTDFKIFADSVQVGAEDGILTQALNHTSAITLDYKKSMFVIGFSALNYRDPGKNQYAYKLEGFDENWLEVGSQRQAKYTNLNAGTYTFKVRASNNDGIWNEEGATLKIIQRPPPWKTWWAYTLYTLLVLAIILLFVRYQKQKRKLVEEQNRLLEIKVSERTAELAQKNNDIQAMLSNMPQGLFTILPGGEIHPEYSAYLEEIFETKDIAGRNIGDLLFKNSKLGSDTLGSIDAAMFAILGEDEMSFDFNEPLLINEYETEIGGTSKILSLDWNPIVDNDIVVKLMISVRDVTQLRQMEFEAREQKRQLEIIGQLLNLSAKKYLGFEESAAAYIEANRQAIELNEKRDDEIVSLLFRNMHTIKGNCRTYGFKHLSNIVHEVESAYTSLKNDPGEHWDREKLLDDLDLVEKGIREYATVYRKVLGRDDESNQARHDGFWMPNAVMEKIQNLTEARDLDNLLPFVSKINSYTLENALGDVIASLPSIAVQLGKKAPAVHVNAQGILVKSAVLELLNDVFAHILRNSVDHGIEMPDDRIRADKDARGTITINAQIKGQQLHMTVEDDGQGINLKSLFEKGVQKNYWPLDAKLNNLEIAQTIFKSGISTKSAVTEISGRGVGMDAVKQFLKARGGNVFLQLEDKKPCAEGFVPFKLVITIPSGYFIIDQRNGDAIAVDAG